MKLRRKWISLTPGSLINLWFKNLFDKSEGILFVPIDEDLYQSYDLIRVQTQNDLLLVHPLSSSSHFLIADLPGTSPEDFTF